MEPLRHHRHTRRRHPAENPPTAQDYYRGVMPDGSPPPALSARLADPLDRKIPGEPDRRQDELDEIERALDMELLRDYDGVLASLRKLKAFCDERLDEELQAERDAARQAREAEAAEAAAQEAAAEAETAALAAGASAPQEAPQPSAGKSAKKPAAPRPPRVRARPPRVVSFLALYMNVLKTLLDVAKDRAGFARGLIQRAARRDIRRAFIEDRAVGVVKETLLELDKTFKDVGFGAWMPFRFPDQWLMFTGVMRRVLAANGLIAAKHADIYRRLLQETPPVLPPLEELPTPQSWGFSGRTKEVPNMATLLQLAREQKADEEGFEEDLEANARLAAEEGRAELEKLWGQYNALNKPANKPANGPANGPANKPAHGPARPPKPPGNAPPQPP